MWVEFSEARKEVCGINKNNNGIDRNSNEEKSGYARYESLNKWEEMLVSLATWNEVDSDRCQRILKRGG